MPSFRLKFDASEVPEGGSLIKSSPAKPLKGHWFEPAGISFHTAALRFSGVIEDKDSDEEGEGKEDKKGESPATDSGAWESSGRSKKKGKEGGVEQDHYALLGLGHLRYLANDDQLKKAYREAALRHHPDKQASILLGEKTEAAKTEKKEEIETHFKAIQLAYEVLTDPVKRRNYDSTDEFDDEVPGGDCAPEDFFKVFGPVFMRNGRWSTIQPALMLGDDASGMEEVDKFYDFWWGFKSWREFPNEDEFDIDSAESREHKRWMERQNSKLREKAKKEENARIRLLVENAWRRDPRIARRKEEEKREKVRKKEEKQRAKRDAEEEGKRAAEEERVRKEEADKRAAEAAAAQRKQREKDKKLVRKERARLRQLAAANVAGAPLGRPARDYQPWGVPDDDVEGLCTALDLVPIRALCAALEAVPDGAADALERRAAILREWQAAVAKGADAVAALVPPAEEEEEGAKAAPGGGAALAAGSAAAGVDGAVAVGGAAATNGVIVLGGDGKVEGGKPSQGLPNGTSGSAGGAAAAAAPATGGVLGGGSKKEKERPWAREEVELLRKALIKYPKGTSQRWEVVSDYIGTQRSVEEILRAIKTVLLQKPDDSKAFASFLQKRKSPKDIASPLTAREEGADDVSLPDPSTSAEEAPPQANGAPSGKAPAANGKQAAAGGEDAKSSAAAAKSKAALQGASKAKAKAPTTPAGEGDSTQPESAAADDAAAGAGGEDSTTSAAAKENGGEGSDGEAWSEAQEVALVRALKAFPKDTDKRWERICAAVPGKTKAQCMRKFSSLRESFRSKK